MDDRPTITAQKAAEMAADVALWTEVIGIHTRDDQGYCAAPGCRNPDGTGAMSYPCPIQVVALWAKQMHDAGEW